MMRHKIAALLGILSAVTAGQCALPCRAQSLADRLKAVQSGDADSSVKVPRFKPVGATTYREPIPLVPGLTTVGAVQDENGDYESVLTITSIDKDATWLHFSADLPKLKLDPMIENRIDKGLGQADPRTEFPTSVDVRRQVDAHDMVSAHAQSSIFFKDRPTDRVQGATTFGLSTEVFNLLKAGKSTNFAIPVADLFAQDLDTAAAGGGQKPQDGAELIGGQWMLPCQLARAESSDVAFPVLLNGHAVELPAISAVCTNANGEQSHHWWLDQESNPLGLGTSSASVQGQIIRIAFPQAAPDADLEHALTANQPITIYGIYFDFGSAHIKPESKTVLDEIARVMQKHGDWRLSLSGHTDSVGGATANQTLSEQRTAAVKAALVKTYGVAPERLVTSGYGASRPIAPNDTLQGRARNRRVELQRL